MTVPALFSIIIGESGANFRQYGVKRSSVSMSAFSIYAGFFSVAIIGFIRRFNLNVQTPDSIITPI